MSINISKLKESDIGRWVEYNPGYKEEKGKIKSWNIYSIFVVYNCGGNWDCYQNYTACATSPEDLEFMWSEKKEYLNE